MTNEHIDSITKFRPTLPTSKSDQERKMEIILKKLYALYQYKVTKTRVDLAGFSLCILDSIPFNGPYYDGEEKVLMTFVKELIGDL